MSDRFEEERFDPERLRRLQWNGEDESVPELGTTEPAIESTAAVEPEVELGVEEAAAADLDAATENVFEAWPVSEEDVLLPAEPVEEIEPAEVATATEVEVAGAVAPAAPAEPAEPIEPVEPPEPEPREHAPGELVVPPGFAVLEGEPHGGRRSVGVVVARFNGDVTTRLLESALAELDARGVSREAVTVMPVPGAFELPLAAMALAKTRRFACIVALGCVIRGDTPHFDYVASEAASGLQLAAIETGVPVAFGVLTLESPDQAEERVGKGAEAVVTALEMADVFAHLRAAASR